MTPFPAGRPSLLAPAALLLLFAGGCTVYVTSTPDESAEPAVTAVAEAQKKGEAPPPAPAAPRTTENRTEPEETEPEDPLPLREMLAAARRNMLEIQTIESLQELAGEHVGNARLLQIPGFIDEQRTSVRSYEADRDPRLKLLDDAIAYNDLLSLPAGVDMTEHRRKRAGELLDYQIAALASRLAASRARLKLAPEEEERRREEAERQEQKRREEELLMRMRLEKQLEREEEERKRREEEAAKKKAAAAAKRKATIAAKKKAKEEAEKKAAQEAAKQTAETAAKTVPEPDKKAAEPEKKPARAAEKKTETVKQTAGKPEKKTASGGKTKK